MVIALARTRTTFMLLAWMLWYSHSLKHKRYSVLGMDDVAIALT